MHRLRLTAVLVSLALHAGVVLPALVAVEPLDDEEEALDDALEGDAAEGDDPDGEPPIEELENTRFRVTLYEETPPPPPAPVAMGEPAPLAEAPAAPAPPPEAPAPADLALALPVPEALPEPSAPEPVPAPEPEPLPEPVLSEAERAALAEMERGDAVADAAPLDDDDGEAHAAAPAPRRTMTWRRAPAKERPPRKSPCPPPVDDIARVAESHWYIDRDLIEFYATNIFELKKLGSVWTHRGADGKLDGFRVGLARCSVLRQGGLRSGDVVHDINGRRIHSVLQAVAAYVALRAEPELKVRITRRGEPVTLSYTVEQPQRKGKKAKKATTASR